MLLLRYTLAILMLFMLSACGGGGNESPSTEIPLVDTDGDGTPDKQDLDDDNDGYEDSQDAFPLDSTEWLDTDSDGTGNNADTDDDNDGYEDSQDAFPSDSTEWLDTDSDGTGNNADTDDDNDGYEDSQDAFPLDSTEWLDTDSDGTGNNADTDDDNDGYEDSQDAFPLDSTEWLDTDSDGTGNNVDTDDDNDGYEDSQDAFPLDSTEWLDTDSDGTGNNADTDDDNDGYEDSQDAFPLDSTEWLDTDSDGTGNNADRDDDNDGVTDEDDAFPLDGTESVDNDNDGIGANTDAFDNDAACFKETDGSGDICYLTYIATVDNALFTKSGKDLFYFLESQNKIVIFDGEKGHFFREISLEPNTILTAMAHNSSNNRLYIATQFKDEIKYIELDQENPSVNDFTLSSSEIIKLYVSDDLIISQTRVHFNTYDHKGTELSQAYATGFDESNAYWSEKETKLIFINSYNTSYINELWFDPTSGEISSNNFYSNNDLLGQQILHIFDEQFFIMNNAAHELDSLHSNGINLKLNKSFKTAIREFIETKNNDFVTVHYVSGNTLINRYDAQKRLIQTQQYQGAPVHIVGDNEQFSVITQSIEGYFSYPFSFVDDSDNDGVNNSLDAFPLDAAATIDTDSDGYPDGWNENWSGDTQLILDEYPNDFSCWAQTHADDLGNCDYAHFSELLSVESYETDSNGNAYLYDKSRGIVARYDSQNEVYFSPIRLVNENTFYINKPLSVTYSENHQRIYYVDKISGIRFYDLKNEITDVNFISQSQNRIYKNVKAVSGFLYVDYINIEQHYSAYNFDIADINSSIVSSNNATHRVQQLLNDNTSAHLYSYSYSDSRIYKYNIDSQTGYVTEVGSTFLAGNSGAENVISILKDSNNILFSNGRIYDADTLSENGKLLANLHAFDISNEQVLLISSTEAGFKLRRLNSALTLFEELDISERYHGGFTTGSKHFYIVSKGEGHSIIRYIENDDSDGDGIENILDHFPNDPAASIDTDYDGYPDSWNQGASQSDSTSGLSLDTFPEESACWLEDHRGDNGQCDYAATIPDFQADLIATDHQGRAYLLDNESNRVYIWDQSSNNYINPLILGNVLKADDNQFTSMALSDDHQRLYLGDSKGKITFFDLNLNSKETIFAAIHLSVDSLVSTGKFLLAQDQSGAWSTHFIFDKSGNRLDSREWNYGSYYWAWNEQNSRVYYYSDHSPRDLHSQVIDQTTGEIRDNQETPYHGDYSLDGQIRISPNSDKIYLASGNVFDANSLEWIERTAQVNDLAWLPNDDKLHFVQTENSVRVERYSDNQLQEVTSFTGSFAFTISSSLGVTLAVIDGGIYTFYDIQINNDLDSDGVINSLDAFPADPSAAVDSDRDGYPDSWNEGKTEADSNSGLILDQFIYDSACWLNSHADGLGNCDYMATLLITKPDLVTQDGNDNILLLNKDSKQVVRWSLNDSRYINPINLGRQFITAGQTVTTVTYSDDHQRLYILYGNGLITYIEDTGVFDEQVYLFAPNTEHLVNVGNYLLTTDKERHNTKLFTYDVNGIQKDSLSTYYSNQYEWDANNSKLFYFRDSVSPNDLLSVNIDQESGVFSNVSDSPYHSSNNIVAPIVSFGSLNKVLLGSGKFYSAESMELIDSLESTVEHAVSYSHLGFYSNTVEVGSEVSLFDANDLNHLSKVNYNGTVLSLEVLGDTLVVTTDEEGHTIHTLEMGDQDSDGIPSWWERLYSMSDDNAEDAIQDADSDGLTNLNEYLIGTNPILFDTDGDNLSDADEVNIHSSNPIDPDSDGDGLNDGAEIIEHGTNVNLHDSDGDGFSDGEEVNVYGTNPLDANSKPQSITSWSESFEEQSLSPLWGQVSTSVSPWVITDEDSDTGSYSLKSGAIGDNQQSEIKLSGLFSKGNMTFEALVSSERCCDRLEVLLNGIQVISTTQETWQLYFIELPEGENEKIGRAHV